MSGGVDRERIAKLVGMLGSAHAGERSNALDAINKSLGEARLTWEWIASLVGRGELAGGESEALLRRLVTARLRAGLAVAWAFGNGEGSVVKKALALCEGEKPIDVVSIKRAIELADNACRRAR